MDIRGGRRVLYRYTFVARGAVGASWVYNSDNSFCLHATQGVTRSTALPALTQLRLDVCPTGHNEPRSSRLLYKTNRSALLALSTTPLITLRRTPSQPPLLHRIHLGHLLRPPGGDVQRLR